MYLDRIGILRPLVYGLKLFFKSPYQLIKELIEDFKKDLKPKSQGIIVCFGLPKSGTTMIEEILSINGSIDGTRSLLRRISYLPKNADTHAFHKNLIKFFPKKKSTFIKTHSPYKIEYANYLKEYNLDYFVSIRDPRQMMLSRYYHILNDKKHRQHFEIKNLDIKSGFKKSLFSIIEKEIDPIDEYSEWINSHLKFSKRFIKYEDYLKDKAIYFEKLSNYSNIEIDIEKTLKILENKNNNFKKNLRLNGREKSTFRKGIHNEWVSIFDEELKNLFKNKFGEALIKLGYEKDYNW